MNGSPLVTFVLGTRPEAIKLAPVIKEFQACYALKTRVVMTGQHREMVAQVMNLFRIYPDHDLDLMTSSQSLTHITCKILEGLRLEFNEFVPNLVFVHGDTTTAFAAALAAFYEQVIVCHVEAGLRTDDIFDPYPEELNRRLISQLAHLHFAPTIKSEENLKSSGVLGKVFVTGNTILDAIALIGDQLDKVKFPGLSSANYRVLLATVHRRENWGKPLIEIAKGFLKVLELYRDTALLLPLHRNPIVREPLKDLLGNHPRVELAEPLEYSSLLAALKGCSLLLTDSGGMQEEALAFGKPVLVLRRTTERPELINAGLASLVGPSSESIVEEASRWLEDPFVYKPLGKQLNPYGDGNASKRILEASLELLHL